MLRHPETSKNLINEKNIMTQASKAWGVKFKKLPLQYKLDFAITRNKNVIGFCEVKSRNCSVVQYNTYIISLKKIMAGLELAKITNTKSMLLIGWNDMIGYTQMDTHFKTIIGGRTDRFDWQDEEPMAEINITKFKKLIKGA